jgi:hypothetical protein
MAAPELGSTTCSPAGNNIIATSGAGTPTGIEFWLGPRAGTTETVSLDSFGYVDITNGTAAWQSNFGGANHQTKNGSGTSTGSSCLQHYNPTGTKVVDIKFVSAAAGTFTINFVTANANYVVFFKVYF